MTGYAQRFIYPFGLTMAFAIMVSLLVSITLTPMLGARMLQPHAGRRPRPAPALLSVDRPRLYAKPPLVARAPRRRSSRSALIVFATTFPLARFVGRSFLPTEDQGEFDLTVDAPEGTSLAGMEKLVLEFGKRLEGLEGVDLRDADHLRAREPLAPGRAAEADRGTRQDAGRSGDGRAGGHAPVRRLPADGRDQVGDRRRRDRELADPREPLRSGPASPERLRSAS